MTEERVKVNAVNICFILGFWICIGMLSMEFSNNSFLNGSLGHQNCFFPHFCDVLIIKIAINFIDFVCNIYLFFRKTFIGLLVFS